MEVAEYVVKYRGRQTEFHLYPLGDIHTGIKHCIEEKIKKKVQQVKDDPYGFWIGMGDYGEFISPSDPRWDIAVIADWVVKDNIAESQTEWIVDLLRPIAHKCIGLLEGNHEDAIRIHNHVDVQSNICKRLGVKNLGYSCFVRFKFQRTSTEYQEFEGVFAHGSGWAITKGAKLTKLQRFMDTFEADIYAMGHMHDVVTDSKPYLMLDRAFMIKDRVKVGAITGSWFQTYRQGVRASYGEKRSYPPCALGSPTFLIKPFTRELSVES